MRKKIFVFFISFIMLFSFFNVKADSWNINQKVNSNEDVMYSWWNTPLTANYGDDIYFGFTNSRGYKGVGKYNKGTMSFTQTYIAQTSDVDDHNTASVVVLKDGHIAAIYSGGHNSDKKIHIRISTNTGDISSFNNEIVLNSAGKTTYSQVLYCNGTYYLFYRMNTNSWVMRTSKDFKNWSKETKIIYNNYDYGNYKGRSDQYYVYFAKTKNPNVIRMVMQSNPVYPDTNIRMGFINLSTGKVLNSDNSSVVGNINDLNMKGLPSSSFNTIVNCSDTITNRLFDVAVTDPNNVVFAYAQHSGTIAVGSDGTILRPNIGSTANYYIYRNGTSQKVVSDSYKFWKKYFGGISFDDSQNFVAAYGTYDAATNKGVDHLDLFKFNGSSYVKRETISELDFSYNGNYANRIIRPLVDEDGEFVFWLQGRYNIEDYKDSKTDIFIKNINGGMSSSSTILDPNSTSDSKVLKIDFENSEYEVAKGKSIKLKVIASPKGTSAGKIKYYISDKSIATIDENGKLTGKTVGKVTVTAKNDEGKKTTCKVEVKKAKDLSSTSLKLSGDGSNILVGKSKTVEVSPSPNKSNPGKLTFVSSNTKVATVNDKGKITAKKMGTSTITVKNNSGLKDSISIKVTELKFKKSKVTLNKVGDKEQLELDHGVKGKVTYSSSDPTIATVSKDGIVTAKGIGITNIVAYIDLDDSVKTSVKVEVGKKIKEIVSKEKSIGLKVGETKQLEIGISPKDASKPTLTYRSLDETIAKVNNKGVVTGVKEGATTIIVNTRDGSRKTANIAVTVSKDGTQITKTPSINKNVNIKLNKTVIKLSVGKSETVKITSNPKKIPSSQLEWYSVKPSVAKVNSKGKITAVGSGKTFVYLLFNGGNKNTADKKEVAMVRVDVDFVKVSSIKFKETKKTIKVGETSKVEVKSINPENATDKRLKWSSSKPNIVSVSKDGTITGLKKGKAIIYAFAIDENKTNATCEVTVNNEGSTPNNGNDKTIKATSIKINQSNVSLGKKQTTKLTVSFAPGNVTSKKLKWVSSNSSIASVDSNGTVKGLKKGTVTITAQTTDGSKKAATCKVTIVNKVLVTSIIIDNKISLKAGKKKTLSVLYSPSSATTKKVKWTSSNRNVAIVSPKGVVKGKTAGTAVITATTTDGSNKTATCTVTVKGTSKSSSGTVNDQQYSKTHTGESIIQKRIFIGDSRTVGMHNAVGSKSSDIWSAATGAGYSWMDKTGVPNIESKITKDTAVIFLMGVNDYGNNAMAESYSKYINDKAAVWVKKGAKVYFVSVNAVDDSKSKIAKNHSINAFNVKVKSLLSKNVTYIDTYNNINWNKVKFDKEGVHYDAATYKSIYNLVLNKVYNVKKTTKSKTGKTNNKNNKSNKKNKNKKTIKVTKVTISGKNGVQVGKTITLKAVIKPSTATNQKVTWKSSDKSIATVSSKGVVKGIKKGTVTITATAKDGSKKKGTYKITVTKTSTKKTETKKQEITNKIPVTSVKISGSSNIKVGKTTTLKVTILPTNATNKNVTWKTSDSKIATVSSKGVVKGIKTGKVTITAIAKDGSKKKDSYTITIKNKTATSNKKSVLTPIQGIFKRKVTKITISGSKTVAIKKTTTLKATISPSNATNKNVTWSSSDNKIATVSDKGVVKGIKQGKVVITATAKDGSKVKGKYSMTVTKYEEMKGKTALVGTDIKVLSFAEETITSSVGVGEYIHFEVFSYDQPKNKYQRISDGKLYTVTSSNENVLSTKSVWKDKKHLTAKSVGTATITITLNSNNKSTSFTVNVVNTPTFSIKNNNRELNDKNCYTTPLKFDIIDNTNKSIYNVQYETDRTYPSTPSLQKRNLSINKNVAHITVYNSHKYIKFEVLNKAGVIYFFGDNREYSTNLKSTCETKTKKKKNTTKKVTAIAITGDKEVAVGSSIKLITEVLPNDASNKEVTWSSNNKSIATVSDKGVVKGIKKGTVTITATAKDGSKKKATYKITVTKKVKKASKNNKLTPSNSNTKSSSNDNIHFLNVGSSDAILIESNGEYGLIDASNPGSGSSINPSFNDSTNNGMKVVAYLNKMGVKHLKFVMASHDHSDHIGGIPELVYNSGLVDNTTTYIYKTSYVDYGGGEVTQGSWQAWNNRDYSNAAVNAMQSKGANLLETSSHTGGDALGATFGTEGNQYKDYVKFKMGDYNIKIYNLYNNTFTSTVGSNSSYITTDENSNSLITVIANPTGKKALLMGDINVRDRFEQYYAEVVGKVDLLKASHHGYNYSNSKYLFDKTKPSIVVIPNNKDLLNTVNMGEGGIGDFGAARIYLKDMGCKVYETGNSADAVTVSFSDSASVSGASEISSKVNDGFYIWYDNDSIKKYYYIKSNKFIKNSYVTDGSKNESGNKNWYWMNKDGVWNGSTYSFVQSGSNWYFNATKGSSYQARSEWVILDNTYYFNESGVMVTGWQKIKGKWYYFNTDGSMQTGWVKSDGKYYYLSPSDGSMQTENQTIKGKKYQFNSDGSLKK